MRNFHSCLLYPLGIVATITVLVAMSTPASAFRPAPFNPTAPRKAFADKDPIATFQTEPTTTKDPVGPNAIVYITELSMIVASSKSSCGEQSSATCAADILMSDQTQLEEVSLLEWSKALPVIDRHIINARQTSDPNVHRIGIKWRNEIAKQAILIEQSVSTVGSTHPLREIQKTKRIDRLQVSIGLLITADRVISYAIANDIVPSAERGENGTRRVLNSVIDDSLLQEQAEIQARIAKLLRDELPTRLSAPSAP